MGMKFHSHFRFIHFIPLLFRVSGLSKNQASHPSTSTFKKSICITPGDFFGRSFPFRSKNAKLPGSAASVRNWTPRGITSQLIVCVGNVGKNRFPCFRIQLYMVFNELLVELEPGYDLFTIVAGRKNTPKTLSKTSRFFLQLGHLSRDWPTRIYEHSTADISSICQLPQRILSKKKVPGTIACNMLRYCWWFRNPAITRWGW